MIEHFETAFWGYESDVDLFNCTEINYNKTGIHLQNRSSQFTSLALFTLGNDTALDLNSSNGARFLVPASTLRTEAQVIYPFELMIL